MKRIACFQRNYHPAAPLNYLAALSAAIGAILVISPSALGQALFTYTFSDVVSTTSGLTSTGGSITGATFSSFSAVGTPANPNASGRFSFTDWSTGAITGSDTFTGGIKLDEYYEFSVTPDSGFALNLDTITFTIQRSSTGIRQYSVRSDLDNYGSNLPASINSTTTALSIVNTPQENIFQIADTSTSAVNGSTLTLGTKYDALTQTVTFRFYGWNAEGKAGTFSIDNVAILGSVAPTVASVYWDANGATAGLGGSGSWSSTSWSTDSTGTATPEAFDSNKKAVFTGTAGNVAIGTGGVTANAGLRFGTDGYTISSNGGVLTLGSSASTVEIPDAGHTATISAGIAGTNGLTKSGSGTLILSADNLYTGKTTIGGGTVEISRDRNLGATTADVDLIDGTLKVVASVALDPERTITGSGNLDIAPNHTLTVKGAMSAGAITLVNRGTLQLSGSAFTFSALNFAAPATVTGSSTIGLNGNITVSHAAGTSTISNPVNFGTFSTTGANRLVTISDASATLAIPGPITLVAPADNGQTPPTPNNNGRLHKLGAGSLELTGNNDGLFGVRLGSAATSAGAIPVAPVDGGILRINNHNALGANAFQFNAGTLTVMQPLIGSNAITIPMTLGASSEMPAIITGADVEFSGEIQLYKPNVSIQHSLVVNTNVLFSGALNEPASTSGFSNGLTIAGTGSLTLAAATNTITELITIEGPTVAVNGTLSASGGVFVKDGMLTGDGSIPSGTLTIGDGAGADAVFAPGAAITTYKTAGLSLDSDAVFRLEIDSNLKTADTVAVSGVISLGKGVAKLELTDLGSVTLPIGTEFTLIDNAGTGPVSGYFEGLSNLQSFFVGKNLFAIDYGSSTENSDVVLRVVPEPGSLSLVLTGIGFLGSVTRRRRKR